jgi:hypothetical protein
MPVSGPAMAKDLGSPVRYAAETTTTVQTVVPWKERPISEGHNQSAVPIGGTRAGREAAGRSGLMVGALIVGVGLTAAACTSGSGSTPTTAASVSNTASAALVSCLHDHGITVSSGAPISQMRKDFRSAPLATQQAAYTACTAEMGNAAKTRLQKLLNKESKY